MNIGELRRIALANLPTPIQELKNLSKKLGGPRIFIKRDDQTGLALGGNKVRKLEFLIAEALAQGADSVITAGAAQSNHCRQTAAAAAYVGLTCDLVLGGQEPDVRNGNLLLDYLFGAQIHWTGPERRGERIGEIAEKLRAEGRRPYVIPYGGSNSVGALGYVAAMEELNKQLSSEGLAINYIVFASSSGGTHAGLVVGARAVDFVGKIIGISIDKGERGEVPYETELARISNETADRVGLHASFLKEDFIVNYDYLGGGYGVVGNLEREAIRLMATQEGILVDPVYTGRTFGGLADMIRRGLLSKDDNVLFWHTGGAPALFAYARDLFTGKA